MGGMDAIINSSSSIVFLDTWQIVCVNTCGGEHDAKSSTYG